jgi:hypothetical protein
LVYEPEETDIVGGDLCEFDVGGGLDCARGDFLGFVGVDWSLLVFGSDVEECFLVSSDFFEFPTALSLYMRFPNPVSMKPMAAVMLLVKIGLADVDPFL